MIPSLVARLEAASTAYYDGDPIMEDEQFDLLLNELRLLDPTNAFLSKVGAPGPSGWNKVALPLVLGSLDKSVSDADFDIWAKKVPGIELAITHKLDGMSCFDGATPVHLANGETMTIKEIVDGDLRPHVISWSPEKGLTTSQIVATINNGLKDNWVELTLEDGSTVLVTEDHLFYVPEEGWVEAKDLLGKDVQESA